MLLKRTLNILGIGRAGTAARAEESPAEARAASSSAIADAVRAVIDEFRPSVVADGGGIELIDVDERGIVRVRMKGACVGCPASFMTLQMGLERRLKERIPGIRAVESV